MITAEEILEMHFGSDFYQLKELDFQVHIISAMKEYAQRIAEQVRQDCTENAKMVHHCGHTKSNTLTSHHQQGADNIQIDKQSILLTEIKVL